MSSNKGSGCLSIFSGKGRAKEAKFGQFEGEDETQALKPSDFPYAVNAQFLSPAENSFYRLAVQVLKEKYTVCPKVSLAELLFVTNQDQTAFNRISRKRIDFVVCDSQTMTPVYAIELDDRSHKTTRRQERDLFVDKVFAAAYLPLVHIENKAGFSRDELIMKLLEPLGSIVQPAPANVQKPAPAIENQSVMTPPICPKCGQPMVLRTAAVGARAGNKFWGCSNYPNCRNIIEIPN